MKKLCLQLAAALLFLALSSVSRATIVNGAVFCDANQDGVIDTGDVGVPGVLVVITNENSSFSNSAVTAEDGSFSIQIPDFSATAEQKDPLSQIYVETLDPATLPPDATIEIPTAITNITSTPAYFITFVTTNNQTNLVFTSGKGNSSTGDWLLSNPECGSAGNCTISGDGHIEIPRQPDHLFNGSIVGDPPGGHWTDLSHRLGLRFNSTSIQSVICGTNSIQFSGTGTLREISGSHMPRENNSVQFTAAVQNITVTTGRRTKTIVAYYLYVFNAAGTTLELESTDPADPTDVAPVPVTTGHLIIQAE